MSGGVDDAADLVQETMLRAYRTFERFTPGTNCRAWLFTILYSVFLNHRARRAPLLLSPERIDAFAATPAERTADEWSPEVEHALAGLPEAFRAAVVLVDVEGLSYEEAAAAMECPVGTVRSRLYRGRTLLAAALDDFAKKAGYRDVKERGA